GAHQMRAPRVESAEGRSVGTHGVARRRGESEMSTQAQDLPKDYQYGWEDKDAVYRNKKHKGLSEDVVREISQTYKQEPDWMLQRRLKALSHYAQRSMPPLCGDVLALD